MKLVMSPAAIRRGREVERKKRMARHPSDYATATQIIAVSDDAGTHCCCHVVTTLDIDRSPIAYALPAIWFPQKKADKLGDRCVRELERIVRRK
jgi:hypothetical protein